VFHVSARSEEGEQHCGEAMECPSAPEVYQAEDKPPHCRVEGHPSFQRASQASTTLLHQVKDVVD